MNITNIKPCGCDAEGMPERIAVEFDGGDEVRVRTYIAENVNMTEGVELYLASSIDTGSTSFPRLICPICGADVPIKSYAMSKRATLYKPEYPHCPNCGVKVDDTAYFDNCWEA